MHSKGVFLVASAAAGVAGHRHRRQEVHFHHFKPGAFALFAAAAGHVEREAARLEAAHLGVRGLLEETADVVEHAGERGGVGAGRAPDGALVDFDDLVYVLDALYVPVRQRLLLEVVEASLEDGHQGLVDERTLAAARHAADADEAPEREADVDVLKVVAGCAAYGKHLPRAGTAHRRHFDFAFAQQVGGRDRIAADFVGRAVVAQPSAQHAGAGTDVHEVVGAAHRLLVVLHYDDGIALIAQLLQRGYELAVVALVQADGRLVEDVNHAHELGADLRGEADTLALAAGEGCRGTIQREVLKSHVHKELQSVGKLPQHVPRHRFPAPGEFAFERMDPGKQVGDFERGDLGDSAAVDFEAGGLLLEARAVALRAHYAVLDVFDDAFPGRHLREAAFTYAVQVVGAVHYLRDELLRQHFDGVVEGAIVLPRHCTHDFELAVVPYAAERHDASFGYGHTRVRDDGLQAHVGHGAKALAVRAAAFGRVEGEAVRSGFLERHTRFRVHEVLGKVAQGPVFHVQHRHGALADSDGVRH